MPNEKVEVAVFDNDLKCRTIKKYEISDLGSQIRIVSGGENHWMPAFDNESFIEMPRRKRFFFFGEILWRRLYFVKKKGAKCVNFETGEAFGPNPEELKEAVSSTLLGKLGKDDPPFPSWVIYLILVTVLGIAAKVFGVIA